MSVWVMTTWPTWSTRDAWRWYQRVPSACGQRVVGGDLRPLAPGQRADGIDHGDGRGVVADQAGQREVVAADTDVEAVVVQDVRGLAPHGVGQDDGAVRGEQDRG